jgi:hypothetical protein
MSVRSWIRVHPIADRVTCSGRLSEDEQEGGGDVLGVVVGGLAGVRGLAIAVHVDGTSLFELAGVFTLRTILAA